MFNRERNQRERIGRKKKHDVRDKTERFRGKRAKCSGKLLKLFQIPKTRFK